MFKWIWKIVLVVIVGVVGYVAYDSYRSGYFNLPDFDENSYAISFKSGLRGIVVDPDIPEQNLKQSDFFRRLHLVDKERRYLGVPFDVPAWFEDAWAICETPSGEQIEWVDQTMPENWAQSLSGARLDAFCTLQVDGKVMPRGLIYSVPRL
ncbi:hypothetical protein [Celeribacter sp.]|uniref:hypothetical protein n=1 Tax=Celeribacter sp. TaxID=1890673 RepID=UPI003A907FC1